MRTLAQLSIQKRLATIAAIFLVAVISISVTSSIHLQGIADGFVQYQDVGVVGQKNVLMISRDMNYSSRLGRSIMLGDDYAKNFGKLEKRIADISGHFENLKTSAAVLADVDQGKRLLAAVTSSETDTKAFLEDSRRRMLALGRLERTAEQRESAWQAYKTEASPLANKARGSFKRLIELQESIMESIHQQEKNKVSSLLITIITVSAIVVIVAGFATFVIARSVTQPLEKLRATMEKIEHDSNLSVEIEVHYSDELGQTASAFNRMLQKFRSVIQQSTSSADAVSQSTKEVSKITSNTANSVHHQQEQLNYAATAIEQMTATVQEVSQHAVEAAEAASKADHESQQGKQVVNQAVEGINQLAAGIERASQVIDRLEKGSDEIGQVLEVIRGIAEQTNLLALNAAIEAARAGEQGRGFSVVADEVRTLASRTQQSTAEIQTMIENLQNGAREAVSVMEESRNQASINVGRADSAGQSLITITEAVMAITLMNRQIATAAQEQSSVVNEINSNISEISRAADQSAQGAQQTEQSVKNLSQLSEQLRGMVSQFTT